MRQIILKPEPKDNSFESLHHGVPVFAKRDGRLEGMVGKDDEGWIVRIGGSAGSYGYHDTLHECLERGVNDFDFTFYIED